MSPSPSFCAALSALTLAFAAPAHAADDNPVFTDPSHTDADYLVQGEYRGAIGDQAYGAHIIAEGDGMFAVRFYPGGLPGDGWKKESGTKDGRGQRADGLPTFTAGDWTARVAEPGTLEVRAAGAAEPAGLLERVVRKSPTLGQKAPEGAVILFDGSNADAWAPGRMTEDGLLAQGATSEQKFQGFSIHLEFRTPYQPKARGQGRGNSGFYAQGRYEVQVLDSFGLDGKDNECGGIYSVGEPAVNMCFPPLVWQTYDAEFTPAAFDAAGRKTANARITVRHNGVIIHDNIEADHATTAAPLGEGPEPGPVYLQDHGNPVRYRNIWVVPR